ncbi:hypothetical protein BCR42DRAFT_188403 [Absidia repens]|uniref:Stress response protein nst1 n=1 Tax=Absidia repens TaxID=90262 RepID=A0A1X2IRL7_9FUNG|nr:hypothetical protein BCR42DRAFT_188403 [Absidia repens]
MSITSTIFLTFFFYLKKYRLLKQQKEEERLAKEAQLKAEEEARRLERERKEEVERQKRDAERQKKEEERQRKEDERLRKEEEKRRRQREDKERRRKDKEEQRQKLEQQRKEEQRRKEVELQKQEMERQQDIEKRQKEEREQLEQQRLALERTSIKNDQSSLTATKSNDEFSSTTDTCIPDETRQRVLMNALLGSSSPLMNSHRDGLSRDEQRHSGSALSFTPPHLDALQPNRALGMDSASISPMLTMPSGSTSIHGQNVSAVSTSSIFSPLGNSIDNLSGNLNKSGRASIPSIGAIGQPVSNERHSFSSSLVGSLGHTEGQMDLSSPSLLKRRSSPGINGMQFQTPGVENSFFSNFLFGDSNRPDQHMHQQPHSQQHIPQQLQQHMSPSDTRSSLMNDTHLADRKYADSSYNWTNDWNASNVLTNGIRNNLFGDGMTPPDWHHMIISRTKTAYLKLDDITHNQTSSSSSQLFYTLTQLHRMLTDMYYDQPIDVRELYDILTVVGNQHGFQCVYSHSHQDYVVRYLYDSHGQHHQQHNFYHHQPSSTANTILSHTPTTTSPSETAVSPSLQTQGLSSFLNTSTVGNAISHPTLSNRSIPSSGQYSSMSPPHLPFSPLSPSFTSPSQSVPPPPKQPQHPQEQQRQEQSQSQKYGFSDTTPGFGALS